MTSNFNFPFRFLGTGGVFDYQFGNSAMTIDVPDRILIDIGPLVFPKLVESKLISTIDFLLITHLHGDHTGGVFQYIFYVRNNLKRTAKILVQSKLFEREIRALLRCLQVPDDYYEFISISYFPQIEPIDTTNKHAVGVTSFGFIFRLNDMEIYYSGDLGDVEVSKLAISGLDPKRAVILHEMHHKAGKSHVNYRELEFLLEEFTVFGYHCNPAMIPPDNKIPLVDDQPNLKW